MVLSRVSEYTSIFQQLYCVKLLLHLRAFYVSLLCLYYTTDFLNVKHFFVIFTTVLFLFSFYLIFINLFSDGIYDKFLSIWFLLCNLTVMNC